jgi:hypothetical protein
VDLQAVLRAPGETETAQGNFQDRLELDEGDPRYQLLTEEEIAAVMFLLYVSIDNTCVTTFFIYLFL